MVSCFYYFRAIWMRRRSRKATSRSLAASAGTHSRCPVCLEVCIPNPEPTKEYSVSTATNAAAASDRNTTKKLLIQAPCSETYHVMCLRRLFDSLLASKPFIPPRCCGVFMPMTLVFEIYGGGNRDVEDDEAGPPMTQCTSAVARTSRRRHPEVEKKLADFRRVYPNAVGCVHCGRWVLPDFIADGGEGDRGVCAPEFGGCGGWTCSLCGAADHQGKLCEGMTEAAMAESRFRRLVRCRGWKRCSVCGWMLSRDAGCREVVCLCGREEMLDY